MAGGASAQQGSRPYLEYVLDLMKKDGHPGRQTAIALKQALDADNVRYFKADTAIGEAQAASRSWTSTASASST